ncbi:hypothetical protein OG474_06370 [Kribbella sp. NBC_01505]|uniref:hypothetical protein n=1 Tax=Kribbella sp. NBC_01505 TaxID=2903580 RepID=UPI0038686F68
MKLPKPLVLVLAVMLIGYGAVGIDLLRRFGAYLNTHEVVYKLSGTAKQINIGYNQDGHKGFELLWGSPQPWASPHLTTTGKDQELSVHGFPLDDDLGDVRCEIWVDGHLAKSEDSLPGRGLGVQCEYRP